MQRLITNREKTLLGITVSAAVLSLAFNFVVSPLLKKNNTVNKEIKVTDAKIKKYLLLLDHKDMIQARYAPLLASARLSQGGDEASFALSELQALAGKSGISIIDIRPQSSEDKTDKGSVIDLKAQGTMEGYVKFIYGLQSSILRLNIKKMTINAKPQDDLLEGDFSIAYFF